MSNVQDHTSARRSTTKPPTQRRPAPHDAFPSARSTSPRQRTGKSKQPTSPALKKELLAARRARELQERRDRSRYTRTLIGWTLIGAAIPGAAFLRARRYILATLALLGVVLAPLTLALTLGVDGLTALVANVATDPAALHLTLWSVVGASILWCTLLLWQHAALRSKPVTVGQNALCGLLIVSLVAASAGITHLTTKTIRAQQSLLATVFDQTGTSDTALTLPTPQATSDPWAYIDRVNILLVGSDAGHDRIGTRPDTLIVASVDTATGNTVLLSLPRNLAYPRFPQGTPAAKRWPSGFRPSIDPHINAVWQWGERNPKYFPGATNPGLEATRQAVGQALGLTLDYWVMVNLQGFTDMVDALGGVTLTVNKPIAIAKSEIARPTEWVAAGRRTLTGYEALWFGRSRWGSDDYDRMRRQRCLVGALAQQVKPAKVATSFPALAQATENNVATSIPVTQLSAFVDLAGRMQGGQMTSLAFTDQVITSGDPNYERIRTLTKNALFASTHSIDMGTPTPNPSGGQDPLKIPGKSTGGTPNTTKTTPSDAQPVDEVCSI